MHGLRYEKWSHGNFRAARGGDQADIERAAALKRQRGDDIRSRREVTLQGRSSVSNALLVTIEHDEGVEGREQRLS